MGEFHGCWFRYRRDFSFRHSLANILQYFNLSSNNFAEGSANISFVVETSPVLANCCCSHDLADASLPSPSMKSLFPSQPTDRNTADEKSDVLESLLLAFSPYRIVSPRLLLQGYVPALAVFGYANIIILIVAGARFGDTSVKAKPEFSLFCMSTNRQQLASQLCLGTDGMY